MLSEMNKTKSAAVLVLKEDINISNASSFQEAVEGLLKQEAAILVLDMQQIRYINSSALGTIAQAALQAKKMGQELLIAAPQEPVLRIFHMVRFDTFIRFFRTAAEACAADPQP